MDGPRRDAGGRTLTEFQANEEVSRPNYRGSDNEKESLSEAYQKALERTVKGLTALPANGAIRLPARTLESSRGPRPRGPPKPQVLWSHRLAVPEPARRAACRGTGTRFALVAEES